MEALFLPLRKKKKSNVDLFITIVYLKFLTSVEVISEKV